MATKKKEILYIAMDKWDEDEPEREVVVVGTNLDSLANGLKNIHGDEDAIQLIADGELILFKAERISVKAETEITTELLGLTEV